MDDVIKFKAKNLDLLYTCSKTRLTDNVFYANPSSNPNSKPNSNSNSNPNPNPKSQ